MYHGNDNPVRCTRTVGETTVASKVANQNWAHVAIYFAGTWCVVKTWICVGPTALCYFQIMIQRTNYPLFPIGYSTHNLIERYPDRANNLKEFVTVIGFFERFLSNDRAVIHLAFMVAQV